LRLTRRAAGAEPHHAFRLVFKREEVVGEGGPYRQFFTDVAQELQDARGQYGAPFFISVPNAENVIGEQRDRVTVKPSANGADHLAMFEFIGVLFGCCLRTGGDLSSYVPCMTLTQAFAYRFRCRASSGSRL
jgi:hypothetical protein